MGRGKLILICQSGGEFVKNNDGSLKYNGGEAQAVNVISETLFDDLKLKLAEMCNKDYGTVSMKYFLPGNTRTLISLSNDRDLKRMIDFHGNSVTADVFVMGKEGFNREALNTDITRENGIKVAESVNRVVAAKAAATTSSPVDAVSPVGSPPARGRKAAQRKATPASRKARKRTAGRKKAAPAVTESVVGVDATSSSPSRETTDSDSSSHSDSDYSGDAGKGTAHSTIKVDMSATPADTVKKRRRTASWRFGTNGPTIVAVSDDGEDKSSRKKYSRRSVSDDEMQVSEGGLPEDDDLDTSSHLLNSEDMSLEQLVTSWKDGITGIGQDFKNVYEFRDALQKYAIAHRFVYKLKKNDNNRASGICVAEGCSWRIHASWVAAAKSFRIKKFINSHTCRGESWKFAHPTKNWLVNVIKDKLKDSPHHKPKDIANGILRDFGIELSYTQVWRGIEDARKQLQGSYKEAYNKLSWYCEKIIETNPGSFATLVVGDDKRFQRLFISFHASLQGFHKGCRPLLFLEATPLKSKYQEVLMTATALDGNDDFFPVAFAIVDVENNDNWLWFLEQLKSALPTSGSITFVLDREKGLKESVLKVFENAYIGYAIFHLLESFKKSLKGPFHGDGKGSVLSNFLAAAHAVRLVGFKRFTEQIKMVSPQAYEWLMQIEPEYWTCTSSKGERHNQITQNVADMYIKLVEEVRESPIMQKIEALRSMVTDLMSNRQTESSTWSTKLTPSKMEKLHEEIVDARGLKVLFSSDTLFEVHDDANHVVNLNNKECTCLGWQTSGLPCHHAIAVFNRIRKSVYDYCSSYFTVDSYRSTYSESISPVPVAGKPADEEDTASDTVHVLPPCPVRSPSLPKNPPCPTESPNQPKRRQRKRKGQTTLVGEAGHDETSSKRQRQTTEDDEARSKEAENVEASNKGNRETTEVDGARPEEVENDEASSKREGQTTEADELQSKDAEDEAGSKESDNDEASSKRHGQITEVNKGSRSEEAGNDEASMKKEEQTAEVDESSSKKAGNDEASSKRQEQNAGVDEARCVEAGKGEASSKREGQTVQVDEARSKEAGNDEASSKREEQTTEVEEADEAGKDEATSKIQEQSGEVDEARDEISSKTEEQTIEIDEAKEVGNDEASSKTEERSTEVDETKEKGNDEAPSKTEERCTEVDEFKEAGNDEASSKRQEPSAEVDEAGSKEAGNDEASGKRQEAGAEVDEAGSKEAGNDEASGKREEQATEEDEVRSKEAGNDEASRKEEGQTTEVDAAMSKEARNDEASNL